MQTRRTPRVHDGPFGALHTTSTNNYILGVLLSQHARASLLYRAVLYSSMLHSVYCMQEYVSEGNAVQGEL